MNTIGTPWGLGPRRLTQAIAGMTAMLALGLGLPAPAGAQVTGTVQIYEHINYTGSSWGFPNGGSHANLGSLNFNDRTSSIRVPAGTVVAAFEHGNFEGRCETFRANDSDLRNNLIGQDSIHRCGSGRRARRACTTTGTTAAATSTSPVTSRTWGYMASLTGASRCSWRRGPGWRCSTSPTTRGSARCSPSTTRTSTTTRSATEPHRCV